MTFTKDHLPQILWHFCYISDLVCCGSLSLACKSLRESVEVTPAQVSPTDLGQHEPMLCIGWYPECVVDHSHVHVTQGCFLLFQTRQGGLEESLVGPSHQREVRHIVSHVKEKGRRGIVHLDQPYCLLCYKVHGESFVVAELPVPLPIMDAKARVFTLIDLVPQAPVGVIEAAVVREIM
eukprot:CAMPEP_0182905420 /NCGR_PEP_ID=MMETSP0034_2-20130328/32932_1 /TAXON_ID=156128 /ORGANISM="Nephroselmis pyriformis, Strain CCMP717" /LENGTH=178 /DNA_ID=CAMNT_0025040831 /DNA_START=1192 /DNA_END=1728 /DNA_ORIENTATION=+